MLRLLTSYDLDKVKIFCKSSILGTRISCYALCYGFSKDYMLFWGAENENGLNCVIAKLDGNMTILTDSTADFDEIRKFIHIIGADSITTNKETADMLNFTEYKLKVGFVYKGNEIISYNTDIAYNDDMREIYTLISKEISDSFSDTKEAYLSFLSDYTYRQSRGYASARCIRHDNKIVACALTASQNETDALLSGIACNRNYRNYGYGKRIVLSLAQEFHNNGKNVYVIALNSSAEGFYRHIGFTECEKIAII